MCQFHNPKQAVYFLSNFLLVQVTYPNTNSKNNLNTDLNFLSIFSYVQTVILTPEDHMQIIWKRLEAIKFLKSISKNFNSDTGEIREIVLKAGVYFSINYYELVVPVHYFHRHLKNRIYTQNRF